MIPTVTDGPFAESKEAIGGTLLLDVATLEEAIGIANCFFQFSWPGQSGRAGWSTLSTSGRVFSQLAMASRYFSARGRGER